RVNAPELAFEQRHGCADSTPVAGASRALDTFADVGEAARADGTARTPDAMRGLHDSVEVIRGDAAPERVRVIAVVAPESLEEPAFVQRVRPAQRGDRGRVDGARGRKPLEELAPQRVAVHGLHETVIHAGD